MPFVLLGSVDTEGPPGLNGGQRPPSPPWAQARMAAWGRRSPREEEGAVRVAQAWRPRVLSKSFIIQCHLFGGGAPKD